MKRKLPKLNSLKQNLARFAICIAYSASLIFAPLSVASAAAVAPSVGYTPITGGNVGGLLTSLGYTERVDGGYKWFLDNTALGQWALDRYYTQDIFGNYVPKIKSGETLTDDDLAPLLGTVIPEDTYYTDSGGAFYVFGDTPASSLYLKASALVGSYAMPVNLYSALELVQYRHTPLPPAGNDSYWAYCANTPFSLAGQDRWFFPYVVTEKNVIYINSSCFTYEAIDKAICANFMSDTRSENLNPPTHEYVCFELSEKTKRFRTSDSLDYTLGDIGQMYGSFYGLGNGNNNAYVPSLTDKVTLLSTSGFPTLTLEADKEKLVDAVVEVKKEEEDDDDNGSTPPTPQTPNNWEIWQTLEALVDQVETGNPTNGGTTFGQYVNNNYNLVDVDINVPDEINNNVNLSGGLDINGKGDINITVHEDISLPTAGDGSGFYNPDAADVVGALGKDNPVLGVISGVFAAIDPALLGVFSVSVSLLLVLGLWKLIRG